MKFGDVSKNSLFDMILANARRLKPPQLWAKIMESHLDQGSFNMRHLAGGLTPFIKPKNARLTIQN